MNKLEVVQATLTLVQYALSNKGSGADFDIDT